MPADLEDLLRRSLCTEAERVGARRRRAAADPGAYGPAGPGLVALADAGARPGRRRRGGRRPGRGPVRAALADPAAGRDERRGPDLARPDADPGRRRERRADGLAVRDARRWVPRRAGRSGRRQVRGPDQAGPGRAAVRRLVPGAGLADGALARRAPGRDSDRGVPRRYADLAGLPGAGPGRRRRPVRGRRRGGGGRLADPGPDPAGAVRRPGHRPRQCLPRPPGSTCGCGPRAASRPSPGRAGRCPPVPGPRASPGRPAPRPRPCPPGRPARTAWSRSPPARSASHSSRPRACWRSPSRLSWSPMPRPSACWPATIGTIDGEVAGGPSVARQGRTRRAMIDRLGAVAQVELAEDVADVRLHRLPC